MDIGTSHRLGLLARIRTGAIGGPVRSAGQGGHPLGRGRAAAVNPSSIAHRVRSTRRDGAAVPVGGTWGHGLARDQRERSGTPLRPTQKNTLRQEGLVSLLASPSATWRTSAKRGGWGSAPVYRAARNIQPRTHNLAHHLANHSEFIPQQVTFHYPQAAQACPLHPPARARGRGARRVVWGLVKDSSLVPVLSNTGTKSHGWDAPYNQLI